MLNRFGITLVATLMAVPAFAQTCPQDFDFVAPVGHDGRATAMRTLQTMFKAGAKKDKEAFLATAADPYIQHSPDMADGMEPVYALIADRPEGFSSKQIPWVGERGFLDNGNYLVMFREVDRGDGTGPSKIFDLMYFNEDGKYAEHWDMRQALAEKTVSGRPETGTAQEFIDNPVTYDQATAEANRRLMAAFLNLAFNAGRLETALELYAGEGYAQHNPMFPDGAEPLLQAVKAGKMPSLCYDIRFILAQNDLVWVYSKVDTPNGVLAAVDMMRVRGGKMVEHWDVLQPVPDDMPHDNGMF